MKSEKSTFRKQDSEEQHAALPLRLVGGTHDLFLSCRNFKSSGS